METHYQIAYNLSIDSSNNYNIIKNLPGKFLIKNLESITLGINAEFERILGYKKPGDAIGKTDFDIPNEASECASEFVKLDQLTIKSDRTISTVDIMHYADGWNCLFVERNLIKDKNNHATSIFCNGINLAHTNLHKIFILFSQIDKKFTRKNVTYLLDNYFSELPLTNRQYECLFFLVRGKSIKEIAKILNISPRTAEEHLDKIKTNLMCKTKSQVIEKAIDSGFMYFIPKLLVEHKILLSKE